MTKQAKAAPDRTVTSTVDDYAFKAMRIYGQEANENRSTPELFDGCKPVQRRLLYAMYDLGVRSNKPMEKAAKVVSVTMGNFHPHGDLSIFGALVTMANSPQPMADPTEGNWGNMLEGDGAAAMRYPNTRMTKYADHVFFAPRLLAVMTKVRSYDDKRDEPHVLPARLPNAIINGNSGIGVGVATDVPSFTVDSVIKVLMVSLKKYSKAGGYIEPKDCMSLRFAGARGYGSEVDYTANRAEFRELVKCGTGTIRFDSKITVEAPKARQSVIRVEAFADGLDGLEAKRKARELEFVKDYETINDPRKEELAYGFVCNKAASWAENVRQLAKIFSTTHRFKMYLTDRKVAADGTPMIDKITGQPAVELARYSMPNLLETWIAKRIALEVRALKQQIIDNQRDARLTEVRILASANLDLIVKVLKSGLNFDGMVKRLAKALKIADDEAKYILQMQVYRLSKLDGDVERKRLADLKKELKSLQALLKVPHKAVYEDLVLLKQQLGIK